MDNNDQHNPLLPELMVTDLERSLVFYRDILGFRVEYQRPAPPFAFLSYHGSQLMIQELAAGEAAAEKLEPPFGRGINFQIETPRIQALVDSLASHRYPLTRGVKDSWYRNGAIAYGCREILVNDPDGYLLRFSEDLGTKEVVE